MTRQPRGAFALAVIGSLAVGAANAADAMAQSAPTRVLEAPSVDVIGTTPLPGLGTPLDQVPANVQVSTDREIDRSQAVDLPNFLDRDIGSVNLNSVQGNPYQVDASFRGFSASPLIGTPQGLSVFQDGVRVNEAFGDTVNWDFIPRFAISSVTVIPGSNPVFGLNTLGGSIGVRMKSGRDYPGAVLNAFGGSFGRRAVEAQYGGQSGDVDFYVGATYLARRAGATSPIAGSGRCSRRSAMKPPTPTSTFRSQARATRSTARRPRRWPCSRSIERRPTRIPTRT